jgi:serine phosphatase RsbU (regulator of sigma subunit)
VDASSSMPLGGHPPALLVSPCGDVRRVESLSTVLGRLEEAVPEEDIEEFNVSLEID